MSETVTVNVGGTTVNVLIEGGALAAGASVAYAELNTAVGLAVESAADAQEAAAVASAAAAAIPAQVAGRALIDGSNIVSPATFRLNIEAAKTDLSNMPLGNVVTRGTVSADTSGHFNDNIAGIRFNTGTVPGSTGVYQGGIFGTENNANEGVVTFPTALTSFVTIKQIGGTGFGGYDEARVFVRAAGVGRETDAYNLSGLQAVPSPIWNTAFGYTSGPVLIGQTLGASGTSTFNCTTASNVSRNGNMPRPWYNGYTIRRDSVLNYGMFVDASSTEGAQWGAHLETPGRTADVAFTVKLKGTQVAGRNLWRLMKASGSETYPDDNGAAIQTGALMAAFDHFGALSLGEVAATPAARLNVHGSYSVGALPNAQATFGVTADATNAIGAKVVLGVGAGTGPYVAAAKYGAGLATASDLTFITNDTNRIIIPAVGIASAANDAAAAAAGVPLLGVYRNGNALQIRLV